MTSALYHVTCCPHSLILIIIIIISSPDFDDTDVLHAEEA
jgi:hypothetical protein